MITIPSDFTEFLYWFKEITESVWASNAKTVSEDWLAGAKWVGLTDDQIDSIENKYAVKFTPEHRTFLRILHTTDRKEKIQYLQEIDGKEVTIMEEKPHFYNWLTDDDLIKKYLNWPFQTIFQDVLGVNKVWLKSWGAKVEAEDEKKAVFEKWYRNAPQLLPLRAHTFLISDLAIKKRPLLSVYGADVIIAGWSIQSYLIAEFSVTLGLTERVYDEENKVYHSDFKKGILDTYSEYFQFKLIYPLPFWDEMILYYGWQFQNQ
jgi:hypothetical protein